MQHSNDAIRSGNYQHLMQPLLIYVRTSAVNVSPDLAEFVEYYLTNTRFFAEVVGYTPLPQKHIFHLSKHFTNQRIGKVFGVKAPADLTIATLVKAEREL